MTERKSAMESIKLSSGREIPVLGLGTWRLTGRECIKAVKGALKLGYTHIDTATIYGNEGEIGLALKEAGVKRSGIFLTSKVWVDSLYYDGVLDACRKSLKALRTDYLDLYLIHWPSREFPMEETLDAMKRLAREGKARSIGVSNFTIPLLKEALKASGVPISVNQVEYHPYLNQGGLLEFCRDNRIVITAYCPLARKAILGDKTLSAIAGRKGKTTAQVSLRWLLQKGMAAIPKASSPEHLRENLDVFGWRLSPQEMRGIDNIGREKRMVNPYFGDLGD